MKINTNNSSNAINRAPESVLMSVEQIGTINKQNRRKPEVVAEEILKHIQSSSMPPFSPFSPNTAKNKIATELASWDSVHLVQLFGSVEPIALKPEPQEIPLDILPEPYRQLAEEVAANTQTSPGFSLLMILACISTCVQRNWVVARKTDTGEVVHEEDLCIWAMAVMLSGEMKTPVFKAVVEPLQAWERENKQKHADSDRAIEASARQAKAKLRSMENDEEVTPEQMAEVMKKSEEKPPGRQLWTGDVTPEQMQNLLCENQEKMALLTDEAGFIDVISGLYNNGRSNYDVFMQAYSGAPSRVDRGGRQIDLPHPVLTIGTTFQPKVLQNFQKAAGAKADMIEKGFLGRAALLVPRSNVGSRDVRSKNSISKKAKEGYAKAIFELLTLTHNYTNSGALTSYTIALSLEAEELWFQFWQHLEDNQGVSEKPRVYEPIGTWTRKAHGLCLRFAGLLHIAKHGVRAKDLDVDSGTMKDAVLLTRLLIPHTRIAFAMAGVCAEGKALNDAEYILEYIKANCLSEFDEPTVHKLNRFKNGDNKQERLSPALSILESHHLISKQLTEKRSKGPRRVYRLVHPALFSAQKNGLNGLNGEMPTGLDRSITPLMD